VVKLVKIICGTKIIYKIFFKNIIETFNTKIITFLFLLIIVIYDLFKPFNCESPIKKTIVWILYCLNNCNQDVNVVKSIMYKGNRMVKSTKTYNNW